MDKVMFFVHYNWTGNGIEELTRYRPGYRKMVNKHFDKIREKAISALNEKYNEWNTEFDEKYSDLDSDYMKYIDQKRNEVLSTIYDEMFKLHTDGYGEIVGDLIGTDSSVHITVIRVSDDWEIWK